MLSLLRVPSTDSETSPQTALSMFDYLEMYSGSKTNHFQKIQKKSKVEYGEMLFLDDESRNRNVEDLGVVMQLVRDGVTRSEVDKGVQRWRERNGKTKEGREREG